MARGTLGFLTRRGTRICAAVLVTLALSGCAEARRQFGIERRVPDEFKVVTRAPLSIPPEFTLPAPQPGATRAQDVSSRDRARSAVFGIEEKGQNGLDARLAAPNSGALAQGQVDSMTIGEASLVARAGGFDVDPGIRQIIDGDRSSLNSVDRNLLSRILDFGEKPGAIVDPMAESQRLRENQALGRPVTEGETPKIERKRSSTTVVQDVLKSIF